jgi:hypothetical protein
MPPGVLFADRTRERTAAWPAGLWEGSDTVAEIKIERKRRHLLPWILALVLLALVLVGLVAGANREPETTPDRGTATTWQDDTPPRLRQYA